MWGEAAGKAGKSEGRGGGVLSRGVAQLMGVVGELQIEGKVIHVIARQLLDHSERLGSLSVRSRDFR